MSRQATITPMLTEHLQLRAPQAADIAALRAIFSDPATSQHHRSGPMTSDAAAADLLWRWQIHWAQHGFGIWAVCRREAPHEVIGFGGVAWRAYGEQRRLHLALRLQSAAWGQGLATELGQAAVVLAFDELNASELCSLISPEHLAAQRIMSKLGMVLGSEHADFPWQVPSRVYRLASEQYKAQRAQIRTEVGKSLLRTVHDAVSASALAA